MLNQVQYDIPFFLKQRQRETSWESLREKGEVLNEVKSYKSRQTFSSRNEMSNHTNI